MSNVLEAVQMFLLFFPLVFTFGFLPQINTFCLSLLEQLEIYVFGGTAQHSLTTALLSVSVSLLSVSFLTGVLVISVYTIPAGSIQRQIEAMSHQKSSLAYIANAASKQHLYSQSVGFSVYCALLVCVAYNLSRQSSDVLRLALAFKDLFVFSRTKKVLHTSQRQQQQQHTLPKVQVELSSDNELNKELKCVHSVTNLSNVTSITSNNNNTKITTTTSNQFNKSQTSSKENDRVDDLNSLNATTSANPATSAVQTGLGNPNRLI